MAVSPENMSDNLDSAFGKGFLARRSPGDWLWAAGVLAATIGVLWMYAETMARVEIAILLGTAVALLALGWAFRPLRLFATAVGAASLLAIWLYGGNLAAAEQSFLLNYVLASQSAIMWMSALYVLATVAYFSGLFTRSGWIAGTGSALAWVATGMGFVGLLVRWRETYLVDPAIGYIPISNLYEAFILFCVVTGLLWLFYEHRYQARHLGGFVLSIITLAVAFLLWYSFERAGHEIEPLVPALNSYWMKIHVPTNFVGYGAFALAAMVGVAYLLRERLQRTRPDSAVLGRLPATAVLDDLMYKSIALGFAFFTIATFLGAIWAAEAWGSYWNWDPKEAWALIVWLTYAGWLHMRLTKGWHGAPMAWWAVIGLLVTAFCFLGVNMFLSGLHSYGEL